jgi:hypothetical protein
MPNSFKKLAILISDTIIKYVFWEVSSINLKTMISKNRNCVHLNLIFAKWKQTDKRK